jgi:hypothetical protein
VKNLATESLNVKELYEKWILDAKTKLTEDNLVPRVKEYLIGQHPEICGKNIRI